MPEHILANLKEKIQYEWKLAFCSAFIIGLFTHLYVFLHKFPNHDGLYNQYSTQAMVTSGRFFLGPASGMSSYFDLPWVIGLLSIFFLALAAVSIVVLFDLKKKLSIVLVAGIVVTFPSVSSTFSYMFTADGYMLGIFMAILAVVLTKKFKYGFIVGGVLVCLSVSIYQANLSVALTFVTLWIIHEIFYSTNSLKNIWSKIIRSGLMVGIGMVGYLVVYKLSTVLFEVSITSYQGMDKAGSLPIQDIPKRISQIIMELKTFFFRGIFGDFEVNFLEILNVLVFILLFVVTVSVIVKKQLYKNVGKLLTLALLVVSLPFSFYVAYFVSPNVFYHMLMVFSLSSVYIFLVVMYDAIDDLKALFVERISSWVTVIVLALTIFNFGIIANIAYFNMELRHEKSVSVANRLVDRIEQFEEYRDIEKMAVFGNVQMKTRLTSEVILAKIPTMTGTTGETFFYKPHSYPDLIENFLGYSLVPATDEELEAIAQTTEYKEMGIWPEKDSVIVIDGIVVVKFEEIIE